MATYLAKLRPGPLPLEDGRWIAYNTTFLAGESGFPALSGTDLIHQSQGRIVLVSGDPGPAPSTLKRVNVDTSTGFLYDADADPDEDDPILDPNSVVTRAQTRVSIDTDGVPFFDLDGIAFEDAVPVLADTDGVPYFAEA